MKFNLRSNTETDTVDPQPPALEKRTILFLAVALAAVVVAVVVATRAAGPARPAAAGTDGMPVPGYMGTLGSGSGGLFPIVEPEPDQVPTPSDNWNNALQPIEPPRIMDDQGDPRRAKYKAALSGGGLIYKSSKDDEDGRAATGESGAGSQYASLPAGTWIEAVLETAIDTDRPGPVTARILHDVRDQQTQTEVILPAGTRVLGRIGGIESRAAAAVTVTWHRLLRPDGGSHEIGGLPSMDQTGTPGLPGEVDRHRTARYSHTALQTVLGLGQTYGAAQLAASGGIVGQSAALQYGLGGAVGGTLRQVGRAPTIRIPAGERFIIFVDTDLAL